MAKPMKTPGVYIVEKSAFPNSVVEVATAVPAFIGHTEQALIGDKSLTNVPRRITSMAEYHNLFGGGPAIKYELATDKPEGPDSEPAVRAGEQAYYLLPKGGKQKYNLYRSLLFFYQNGGGPCYIVSVGDYNTDPSAPVINSGIDTLIKEQEPTMVVVPEAVLLGDVDACASVQTHSMAHCQKMQSRISILDVYDGYKDRAGKTDCVTIFRGKLGVNALDYAAAYYPWVHTTIVQDNELGYESFDEASIATLTTILTSELEAAGLPEPKKEEHAALIGKLAGDKWQDEAGKELEGLELEANEKQLDKALVALSPKYKGLLQGIKNSLNLLPPSAAMAGVYTMVDNTRGVWKAPANVSLNGVIRPAVNISHDEQEDLNVHSTGKSVNAIRSFIGEGTLVWGGRTLDGNSLDWRYIQVRRTLILLEQSLKLAAKAYVFEANDANTWVTMKSMARNFLTGIWKRGGLAGTSPDDAFSVHVGLGETMTPEDILEGILRITILVAPTRPAEFIEITFQQQMQKS